MKIAMGSDMPSDVAEKLIQYLEKQAMEVTRFGALLVGESETRWPVVGYQVAQAVLTHPYDFGIVCCWTGTGISMAANKVEGIRAALCVDAETARGAKKWNDANVLALSLRLTSEEVAKEIVNAWLEAEFTEDEEDQSCLAYLRSIGG
ncbi:MAG: RpiB/LacA/LacB family sugar-phosphate isomerase [Flammeovirgaceae bacterium]